MAKIDQAKATGGGRSVLASAAIVLGVLGLAALGVTVYLIYVGRTGDREGVAGALSKFVVPETPIERDRRRIRDFSEYRSGSDLEVSVQGALVQQVDAADLEGARAEFSGPIDRAWRTPEALAREFVFRVMRPGDMELLVAESRASAARADADASLRLIDSLETAQALDAVANALWSPDALRTLQLPATLSATVAQLASSWGPTAESAIRDLPDAAAVGQMREASITLSKTQLLVECQKAASLRDLVARVPVDAASAQPPEPARDQDRRERAKASAQAAAITLSSIAEARADAISDVRKVCRAITAARIREFLDSMSGLYDTPRAAYKILADGENKFVGDQLEAYVTGPAGVAKLCDSIRQTHARALSLIPNRIRDECDREVVINRSSRGAPNGAEVAVPASVSDLTAVTSVDLLVGSAGVLDAALLAAVGLELVPEPTGITKVAGLLVGLGDIAWQLSQVSPGLQRRAEQAALLDNAIARAWIGSAGQSADVKLIDGTLIDRAHAAAPGALYWWEQQVFIHLGREIQERLKP